MSIGFMLAVAFVLALVIVGWLVSSGRHHKGTKRVL